MKRHLFFCIFGVLVLGFGSAICRIGQIGLDPCTSMNAGIAQELHSALGMTMMVFQVILLTAVFILNKSYINWGTVINGLCLGYCIDLFTIFFKVICPFSDSPGVIVQIICMFFGIAFITLGISLYFTGNLGLSPYDAVGKIFHNTTSLPYPICRILTDMLCIMIGFCLQGPIGPGTVITACFTGPLIQFWNKKVSEPLFQGKQNTCENSQILHKNTPWRYTP